MHYMMLVTLALAPQTSSEVVRQEVYNRLIGYTSFCDDGGLFGSPLADWFVIGGRWSGILAETVIGGAHKTALISRFPEMAKEFWPKSLIGQHRTELDALWTEHGGSGLSPYTRSSYEELGFTDDAMLLTQQLYDSLVSQHQGQTIVSDGIHCEFVDLDNEPLEPDFVGRKWLVIVDYHS